MKGANNKGQLTIFIVAGILIVVAIAFYFLFRQGLIPNIGGGKEINPNSFLESCIEEKINEAIDLIAIQGGNIKPELKKRFKFKDEAEPVNISYLCYNQNSYDRCINQVPMLTSHIETEIENYIRDDVKICFNKLAENLEKQNYDVKKIYNGFEVKLNFEGVKLILDGELDLIKNDESSKMQNIGTIIHTNLYELVLIVHSILNSEAQYCEFNINSYMLIYPDIKISLFIDSEGEKIYSVKNREIDKLFRFAVRGCIIG
ncbi:MAG: hypothetical protein ABFQ65_00520 [Nanoarchaeota archaeon]